MPSASSRQASGNLPADLIQGFCAAADEMGTSGMQPDRLREQAMLAGREDVQHRVQKSLPTNLPA
jgi:hypothetical protein